MAGPVNLIFDKGRSTFVLMTLCADTWDYEDERARKRTPLISRLSIKGTISLELKTWVEPTSVGSNCTGEADVQWDKPD